MIIGKTRYLGPLLSAAVLSSTATAWEIPWFKWPSTLEQWENTDYQFYDIETLTDGSVWATHDPGPDGGAPILLEVDPETGAVVPHIAPASTIGLSQLKVLDRSPNDTLWITDVVGRRLLNFDPAELDFEAYELPEEFGSTTPYGVRVAPDGRVWFTCWEDRSVTGGPEVASIGMLDPAEIGLGDEVWRRYAFDVNDPDDPDTADDVGDPIRIALDGQDVWFTLNQTSGKAGLGRLTLGPSGDADDYEFTFFTEPEHFDYPLVIPHGIEVIDGTVWFIDGKTFPDSTLVRFVDDGTPPFGRGFPLTGHFDVHNLAVDPDGVIWFTAFGTSTVGTFQYDWRGAGVNRVGSIETDTASKIMGIAIHPTEREVWFAKPQAAPGGGASSVGRVIPSRTAYWFPDIAIQRSHDVYARWRQDIENTDQAPYVVASFSEAAGVPVDQQLDGSDWHYLTSLIFETGAVSIWNEILLIDSPEGRVVADAIGLDSTGDGTPDIVVDDGDSGFVLSSGGTCFPGFPEAYDGDFCYFGNRQDFEHDGIHDAVDTEPFDASDEFLHEVASGILDRGDQELTVEPAPFVDGVLISASCAGGSDHAFVSYTPSCPDAGFPISQSLSPCQSLTLDCGSSVVLRVLTGPIEFELDQDIVVTVPSRAQVTLAEAPDGTLDILNSGKLATISVSYGGQTLELEPGLSLGLTQVDVDIKPGSSTNPINPGSKGKIPVAILTTDMFDASTVDAGTVRFGPGGAEPVWYRLDDVDYDGDLDLALKFNTQDTGIACGDTEATLTGQTIGSVQITGTDSLRTVGCPK